MNANKWLVMTCALFAMTASAGTRGGEEVVVDTVSRFAYGSITGAYNSADPYQLIYCSMRQVFTNYGSFTVTCAARNASGTWGACSMPLVGSSTETTMREMLTTIDEHSIIEFAWDTSGKCTYIDVRRSSHPAPKRTP